MAVAELQWADYFASLPDDAARAVVCDATFLHRNAAHDNYETGHLDANGCILTA